MAHAASFPALNADVAENEAAVLDGRQTALLDLVDWANIACGGHAGSQATVDATVRQCGARAVHVGAHPSYPDRIGFGRVHITIERDALFASIREQLALVVDAARRAGVAMEHIKPHGALYHDASDDADLARALSLVADEVAPHAAWVLRARSAGLFALRAENRKVFAEAFVDRRYGADGQLVPRATPGAVLDSPSDAAAQAQALVHAGGVDTLCIHGDHPRALEIARAVRGVLRGRSAT